MQSVWRTTRWTIGKLVSLSLLVLAALLVVTMPALLVWGPRPTTPGAPMPIPTMSLRQWLTVVWSRMVQWGHGQFIPQTTTKQAQTFWRETMASLSPELLVTLKLIGTALAVGALMGILFGWLISRLGPARVRKPVFGLTLLFASLPDLLVATFFDIALALAGRAWGFRTFGSQMALYTKYIGPSLALAVLITPYIARVTAGALEEVSGELYVRTALAKGLPRPRVVVKHIGKNVLVRLWTVLPVIMSILISGTVMVEYMSETHGIGRGLLLILYGGSSGYRDRYAAVFKMLPLLLLFTLAVALSEWGLRRLDPRTAEPAATGAANGSTRTGGPGWHVRDALHGVMRVPGALWESIRGAVAGLPDWLGGLPRRLWAALGALKDPILLLGVLMVVGMIGVAVFAPHLATHDPNYAAKAFQDKNGNIWMPGSGPDPTHWLGTDTLGRDVYSRVIYGTRYALLFAALATPARFGLALALGLLAAWRGGIWDKIIRWLTIFFTALPQIILPLIAISVFNSAFSSNVAASVAWGVFWVALPGVARLASSVRQLAQTVLAAPFLEGGIAAGAGTGRLLFRYVLPQMAAQLFTMFALEVPQVLTMTATLSYFRTVPGGWIYDDEMRGWPRIPEWGSMMDEPLMIIFRGQWWLWAPFAALFVAVLAFNLVGEGLRRRLRSVEGWQL